MLSAANPGHPYDGRAKMLISGLKEVRPGGRYLDFSAPGLDGNEYRLSEEIAGKIAVIDVWHHGAVHAGCTVKP